MKSSMMKHAWQSLVVLLFMLTIMIGAKGTALADVNIGDYIDQSNWQKVEGMVPDVVLEYLKKGWISMRIGKLNYEPSDVWFYTESEKRNKGKYGIAEDGQIVEKASGVKSPLNFIAAPFPLSDLDPQDPTMSRKVFYNTYMLVNNMGSWLSTATLDFIGPKQFERYISGPQKVLGFLGIERSIENQKYSIQFGGKDITTAFIMKLTEPYELNGLATMTYTFFGNTPERVFSYIPALRRVRTMTAASRSDSMFGTDYSLDDVGCGWSAKPMNFNFKYVRTQEALAQYTGPEPIKFFPEADGSISIQKTQFATGKFGHQTLGWKGKPWAVTNSIWVKRKVYVIEATAKDPYYNYGKMEMWMDTKTLRGLFKIISDRSMKRWKVMIMNSSGTSVVGSYPWGFPLCAAGDIIYDEQRDHATAIREFKPGELKHYNVKLTPDEFTMTGFSKIGK